MKRVDLNADMGESYGIYRLGDDEGLLEFVSSASIACGFHGGDPMVMRKTLRLALLRGVCIGAHPSFLDREGFGRREIRLGREELESTILYQLGALEGMARSEGCEMKYVKPHGAMNTMACKDEEMARVVVGAVKVYDSDLRLLVPLGSCLESAGEEAGMVVVREIFADRAYGKDGHLVPRYEEGALIEDVSRATDQVLEILGNEERLVGSVCVHGDGVHALDLVRCLSEVLSREGYEKVGLDRL